MKNTLESPAPALWKRQRREDHGFCRTCWGSYKMFKTWGKNYLREVEDRLWRDHSYERKNKSQTSASRESEEGENQEIQMSDICPKQQLIDKIRTEINSATSQLEKFEEENGADLT